MMGYIITNSTDSALETTGVGGALNRGTWSWKGPADYLIMWPKIFNITKKIKNNVRWMMINNRMIFLVIM
jgi:hypothetical protein